MLNIKKILILSLLATLPMQVTATSNPAMVPIISYLLSDSSVTPQAQDFQVIKTSSKVAYIGEIYKYKPLFYNAPNTKLSYSVKNKPSWLSFDSSTGEIQGTPTTSEKDKKYDISIKVNNTNVEIELHVEVKLLTKLNLADKVLYYVTQGQVKGKHPVEDAFDDDITTYSQAHSDFNWYQVDLKTSQKIAKIIILPFKDSSTDGIEIYLSDRAYSHENMSYMTLISTIDADKQSTIYNTQNSRYLIIKSPFNKRLSLANLELYKAEAGTLNRVEFEKKSYSLLIGKDTSVTTLIDTIKIKNPLIKYTYSLSKEKEVFSIDSNGHLSVNSGLNKESYSFNVIAKGSDNSLIAVEVKIELSDNYPYENISVARDVFYKNAKNFSDSTNLDSLIKSYINYSYITAKDTYTNYMSDNLNEDTWKWIKNDNLLSQGLFASSFPANPYVVKNLENFKKDWSSSKMLAYKNVALGISLSAQDAGLYREVDYGKDFGSSDHPMFKYEDIVLFKQQIANYKDTLYMSTAIEGHEYRADRVYSYIKREYNLHVAEEKSFSKTGTQRAIRKMVRHMRENNIKIDEVDFKLRKEYEVSYLAWDVYRVLAGLKRDNLSKNSSYPLPKIKAYMKTKAYDTKEFLQKIESAFDDMSKDERYELINPDKRWRDMLTGDLDHITNGHHIYKMMSFSDFANMKIELDQKKAMQFDDDKPNWPLFDYSLSDLAWQVISTEHTAQKRECEYVQSRFFERDPQARISSYPINASLEGDAHEQKRFIDYGHYNTEVDWHRGGDWNHQSVYGILQLGGVCYRQSELAQHTRSCLNQPSTEIAQPIHSLILAVTVSRKNRGQLFAEVHQSASNWGSSTYKGKRFFKTNIGSLIREKGLERYSGMIIGTSTANSGHSQYSKSMMLQRVATLLVKDNSSPENVLREAIKIAPANIDAWYQLAAYYTSKNQTAKRTSLSEEFQSIEELFISVDATTAGPLIREVVANIKLGKAQEE